MSYRDGEVLPIDDREQSQSGVQEGARSHSSGPQHDQPTGSGPSSPSMLRRPPSGSRGVELAPLMADRPGANTASLATRPSALSTILNPTEAEERPTNPRRRLSRIESPTSSHPILPPISSALPLPSANNPAAFTASPQPQPAVGSERAPRRILTPKSPYLHRAASLNQLVPPSATINAQQAPFPPSPRTRTYTMQPGTHGAPALPPLSIAARPSYPYSNQSQPSQSGRRTSTATEHETRPVSGSTSPSASYSPYSQAERGSPGQQYARPHMQLGPAFGQSLDQRPMGVPITSSSGQNVYQMMTLETTSGTVRLPVDVQAASRVADEKRRRNAGASARFRQRRKEKEKESSSTIGKLEQRVRDLTEEMEFYRHERDYLRGVLLQIPGGDRHFPRQSSPRTKRNSSSAMGSVAGSSSTYAPAREEQHPRHPEEGRNVRRRTSTLSLPHPQPPLAPAATPGPGSAPPLPGPPPYQPLYATLAGYAPHQAVPAQRPQLSELGVRGPLPPGPGPSPMERPVLPRPSPAQLMQAPPQTGPWNPYASDRRPATSEPGWSPQ